MTGSGKKGDEGSGEDSEEKGELHVPYAAQSHADPRLLQLSDVARRAEVLRFRGCELREGVAELLRYAPELGLLINEACAELRRLFGAESEFALERFEDPDSPESRSKIFLLVKTGLEVEEASKALALFDEQWWLDNTHSAKGRMQVDVEFQ